MSKKEHKIDLAIDLWQEIKQGDRSAFNAVIRNHYSLLFNYGLKISPDQQLVEDCIQELFIYIWEHRDGLGDVKVIKAYLITSLRRRIINQFSTKEQKLTDHIDDPNNSQYNQNFNFSHEDFLVEKENKSELLSKLQSALKDLPERQREAVYLKYYSGLNYEEIAQIMDMEKQSVANVLRRAILSLKALFGISALLLFKYVS